MSLNFFIISLFLVNSLKALYINPGLLSTVSCLKCIWRMNLSAADKSLLINSFILCYFIVPNASRTVSEGVNSLPIVLILTPSASFFDKCCWIFTIANFTFWWNYHASFFVFITFGFLISVFFSNNEITFFHELNNITTIFICHYINSGPSIGILPIILGSPSSCSLVNLHSQIAQFDKIIIVPFLVFTTRGFLKSVFSPFSLFSLCCHCFISKLNLLMNDSVLHYQ